MPFIGSILRDWRSSRSHSGCHGDCKHTQAGVPVLQKQPAVLSGEFDTSST
jgi:hypothetical protein